MNVMSVFDDYCRKGVVIKARCNNCYLYWCVLEFTIYQFDYNLVVSFTKSLVLRLLA